MNTPIALGKEEETLISPKIDLMTLQKANTALSNRLDNYKRQLVKAAEIEQKCLAISESYDYFFGLFFSGWNNFLMKLERINLLVKEQDSTDKISMFRLIFDNIRGIAQVINKLQEASDKAPCLSQNQAKEQQQEQQSIEQLTQVQGVSNNNNATDKNSANQLNKISSSVNKIELQKLTKNHMDSFLQLFESIYTEVITNCSTYSQRINEQLQKIATADDSNEAIQILYKENSRLAEQLKQFDSQYKQQVPPCNVEKNCIADNCSSQSKIIEQLQKQLHEERQLVEQLSLRVRNNMDYSAASIQAKVGCKQSDNNQDQAVSNYESQGIRKKIEIKKEGFECICGGYQAEYFSQKLEDAAKKITDKKLGIQSLSTNQSGTPIGSIESLLTKIQEIIKESQSSPVKAENKMVSNIFDHKYPQGTIEKPKIQQLLGFQAIQGVQNVSNQPISVPVILPEDGQNDRKQNITLGENITTLEKQNDQVTLKSELEISHTQIIELKKQLQLNNIKYTDLQANYADLVEDYARVKQKIVDVHDVLQNIDMNQLNDNVNQSSSNESTTNSEEKESIKKLTALVECSCGERIKDVILLRCLHPFCHQCIDRQITNRQRKCPRCCTPFGSSDVKPLYLSN